MSWESDYQKEREERKVLIEHNKNLLFPILKTNKIKTVVVEFDGSGDSGQIESVVLSRYSYDKMGDKDEKDVDKLLEEVFVGAKISNGVQYTPEGGKLCVSESDTTLEEVISGICYNLMDIEHPGWENNEGGYGEFVFDLEKDTIFYTHNERITDYNTTEHKY
jgi:hypothetical protein